MSDEVVHLQSKSIRLESFQPADLNLANLTRDNSASPSTTNSLEAVSTSSSLEKALRSDPRLESFKEVLKELNVETLDPKVGKLFSDIIGGSKDVKATLTRLLSSNMSSELSKSVSTENEIAIHKITETVINTRTLVSDLDALQQQLTSSSVASQSKASAVSSFQELLQSFKQEEPLSLEAFKQELTHLIGKQQVHLGDIEPQVLKRLQVVTDQQDVDLLLNYLKSIKLPAKPESSVEQRLSNFVIDFRNALAEAVELEKSLNTITGPFNKTDLVLLNALKELRQDFKLAKTGEFQDSQLTQQLNTSQKLELKVINFQVNNLLELDMSKTANTESASEQVVVAARALRTNIDKVLSDTNSLPPELQKDLETLRDLSKLIEKQKSLTNASRADLKSQLDKLVDTLASESDNSNSANLSKGLGQVIQLKLEQILKLKLNDAPINNTTANTLTNEQIELNLDNLFQKFNAVSSKSVNLSEMQPLDIKGKLQASLTDLEDLFKRVKEGKEKFDVLKPLFHKLQEQLLQLPDKDVFSKLFAKFEINNMFSANREQTQFFTSKFETMLSLLKEELGSFNFKSADITKFSNLQKQVEQLWLRIKDLPEYMQEPAKELFNSLNNTIQLGTTFSSKLKPVKEQLARFSEMLKGLPQARSIEQNIDLISRELDQLMQTSQNTALSSSSKSSNVMNNSAVKTVVLSKNAITELKSTFDILLQLQQQLNTSPDLVTDSLTTPLQQMLSSLGQVAEDEPQVQKRVLKQVLKDVAKKIKPQLASLKSSEFQSKKLEQLRTLERIARSQEVLEQLNPILQASGDPIFLMFPNLVQNFLSTLEITFQSGYGGEADVDAEGKKESSNTAGFKHARLKADLAKFGAVSIELFHREQEVFLQFNFEKQKIADYVAEKLPILRRALFKKNFKEIELRVNTEKVTTVAPKWARDLIDSSFVA